MALFQSVHYGQGSLLNPGTAESGGWAVQSIQGLHRPVQPMWQDWEHGGHGNLSTRMLRWDSFPVALKVWVEAPTDDKFKAHLRDVNWVLQSNAAGSFAPPLLTVVMGDGETRQAPCRLVSVKDDIDYPARFGVFEVALENMEGCWRGVKQTVTFDKVSGQAPGQAWQRPCRDTEWEIDGPVTNPRVSSVAGGWTYPATVADGETLRVRCFPPKATIGNQTVTSSIIPHDQAAYPSFADIDLGSVKFTGANMGDATRVRMTHAPVLW